MDARSERTRREAFVERHREILFALSLLIGGLVYSIGLIFLVLAISVGTEPPGTRFASQFDRLVVGGASIAIFGIGAYIVLKGIRLAGW